MQPLRRYCCLAVASCPGIVHTITPCKSCSERSPHSAQTIKIQQTESSSAWWVCRTIGAGMVYCKTDLCHMRGAQHVVAAAHDLLVYTCELVGRHPWDICTIHVPAMRDTTIYKVASELISCSCIALPIYSSVTCQKHGEGVWLSGTQLMQRQDRVKVHGVTSGDEVIQHAVTVAGDVCLHTPKTQLNGLMATVSQLAPYVLGVRMYIGKHVGDHAMAVLKEQSHKET